MTTAEQILAAKQAVDSKLAADQTELAAAKAEAAAATARVAELEAKVAETTLDPKAVEALASLMALAPAPPAAAPPA